MNIKIRLIELGRRQSDLLAELHARGHKEIDASMLSKAVNFKRNFPKSYKIRELCWQILSEWANDKNAV